MSSSGYIYTTCETGVRIHYMFHEGYPALTGDGSADSASIDLLYVQRETADGWAVATADDGLHGWAESYLASHADEVLWQEADAQDAAFERWADRQEAEDRLASGG